jgi:hypothetical protein
MGIRALPSGEWPEELGDSGFKSASIFVQHNPILHAAGLTRQSRLSKGTCSKLTTRQGPPPRDRRSVMPTDFVLREAHARDGEYVHGCRILPLAGAMILVEVVCEALLPRVVHYHCDSIIIAMVVILERRGFIPDAGTASGPSGWPRHQLPHFACSAAGRCPGPMPVHGTE